MFEKLFDRYITKISSKRLFFVSNIFMVICFVLYIFIIQNYLEYALFLIAALLFVSFSIYNYQIEFSTKQKKWLKDNGIKILSHTYDVGHKIHFNRYSVDFAFFLNVTANYKGKKMTFTSDARETKLNYLFFIKSRTLKNQKERAVNYIVKYLENHGGEIEIYIHPQNPQIYWVDTNWLHLELISDKYEKIMNTPIQDLFDRVKNLITRQK